MEADVQTSLFFFMRYPKPDKEINHFKNDQGHDEGKGHGYDYGEELDPELTGVAEEKAVRTIRIDACAGKETGGQCAPDPGIRGLQGSTRRSGSWDR